MRAKRYLTQVAVATTVAAGLALALQGVVLAAAVAYSPGSLGNDISYPNCGGPFPTGSDFGIVGVTGGRAFTQNICLSAEYGWATALKPTSPLTNPGAALYMNLNAPVGSTARYGLTGPYGKCSHKDKACIASNYGFNAASAAYNYAADEGAASSSWWLDIETSNSWSSNTSLNQDTISGAVHFFATNSVVIGFYSTRSQWTSITGQHGSWSPNKTSYPIWQAGASSESNAKTICASSTAGFAGTLPELVQYVYDNFDTDYAC
jgi:hypothetical protein